MSTATITSSTATTTTTTAATDVKLKRTLGLKSLVLFGLADMTPIIVIGTFGVIAETSMGAAAASFLLASVVMLFTAASYGRMAAQYPQSGSAYTYVGKAIDPHAGFLVGWSVLLDYVFIPMVIWLIGASYLHAQFPGVPNWLWILGFVVTTTIINIIGLNVADKINYALMTFQVIVIVVFMALCVYSLTRGLGSATLLSPQPFTGDGSSPSLIVAGASVAAYSFLGFDVITTLSEESVNPRRDMPKAIFMVALIGGLVFVPVSYILQLVHPGGVFTDSSSAAYGIAQQVGGSLLTALFVAGLCVGQFTSGIAAQATASRLLYVMGRDGVLPGKFFARLSKRFSTPSTSIALIGLIGLFAMFLDVAMSTSFVNFGAFTAFTMVNVAVIATWIRSPQRKTDLRGILRNLVCPVLGAAACLFLLLHLDAHALILGCSWLVLGVIIMALVTHGFRRPMPSYADEV